MIGGVDDIGHDLLHPALYRASPNSGALPFGSHFAPGFLFRGSIYDERFAVKLEWTFL